MAYAKKVLAVKAKARPLYFSDGDTRPVYRGTWYSVIRRTGLAWLVLCVYGLVAARHFYLSQLVPLLLCRVVHIVALTYNVILSDDLHNLDKKLGTKGYQKPGVTRIEQALHARDWMAALAVPASYHLMLIFGIVDPLRVERTDALLLGANLLACLCMCSQIKPSRITPQRPLFLGFVGTFAVQMALLLAAFYRERAHHGAWLPLWLVYALGLIAKGLEFPSSDVFGHHEVLHASCIAGHFGGLLVDMFTT